MWSSLLRPWFKFGLLQYSDNWTFGLLHHVPSLLNQLQQNSECSITILLDRYL